MNLEFIEDQFYQTAEKIINELHSNEYLTVSLRGESSLFIRMNTGKMRQPVRVDQLRFHLQYNTQDKSIQCEFPFYEEETQNLPLAIKLLEQMRSIKDTLPKDPFVVVPSSNGCSRENFKGSNQKDDQIISNLFAINKSITAFYSSGVCIMSNINSAGQKHWFSNDTFSFSYSLLDTNQNAIKGIYAGSHWDQQQFLRNINESEEYLLYFKNKEKNLLPGRYRVYLAPQAVAELLHMFSWGGLSEAAIRSGSSCFQHSRRKEQMFSPKFHLIENFELGWTPRFNQLGELSPARINLISEGYLVETLINSKTAKEYSLSSNGANASEGLRSPEIFSGSLKKESILKELNKGIYISNLHYLNWSDLTVGRVTGMTRYGSFWVENGSIVSSTHPLRFDETLFHIFGSALLELSENKELIPDLSTYSERALGSVFVPGILVEGVNFTH